MTFVKPFTRNQIIAIALLLTLTVFQLVRVIVFVNEYGGLEHDGGWLLGVSRSLAERGTFTTMVSTIVDPNITGGRNVDGNVDIQDSQGRIRFYVANSVGPIVFGVNALFFKFFGVAFWSLHVGSLFFFVLFLLLGTIILLKVQGLGAALLFQVYLFLYPHLSIFLSYEALGEMPGIVCIFLAYLTFIWTVEQTSIPSQSKRRLWWFYLSGLIAGLAINTKLLALLSLGGIAMLWVILLWQRRTTLKDGVAMIFGALTIPILWELTHLVVLTRVAGFDMYQLNLQGRRQHFVNEGSGIGTQDYGGLQFYLEKALTISEISHPGQIISALTLLLVFIGGGVLIWHHRHNRIRQNWAILLWVGWLGNAAWFIGIGKTGWVRHAWVGLILAVMILCVLFGETLVQIIRRPNRRNVAAMVIIAIILIPSFVAQRNAATFFISDTLLEQWRQKQINAKYSRIPWMITPRAEQEHVVEILQQLPPEANIFYPANHKAAEIAVQTDRILYPIARRDFMPQSPDDAIIIGITLISPWKDLGVRHSLIERAKVECPNFLYQSEYYLICRQW